MERRRPRLPLIGAVMPFHVSLIRRLAMDRFNSNCFFANGIDFKEHKSTLTEMDVTGITWALGGVSRV